MLKELFDAVVSTAQKAAGDHVQELASFSRHKQLLVNGEQVDVAFPPRCFEHIVRDLLSLLKSVETFVDESVQPVVFHDSDSIQVVCEQVDGRDTVIMPLLHTEEWEAICELSAPFDHNGFVRLLSHDLRKCLGLTLLSKVRKLKVTSQQESDRQHGRERGTAEFAAEIAEAQAIPEVVTAAVQVYQFENCPSQSVQLSLDLDLPRQTFRLMPLPDELSAADRRTQEWIHDFLVQNLGETPVLHGRPNYK